MIEATKLAQICQEFQNYKLEVLGLSEIRWKGSGEKRTSTGQTLLYSGKPECEDHSSGVGILLSHNAMKCLREWKPISDRIITARFKTKARALTIVQIYAPTEQTPLEIKEAFYSQLSMTLVNIRKSDITICMGDANAKVGNSNINWGNVMGNHGAPGEMNENGEMFADMCSNNDLVIGGTLFPHKNVHKVTWVSPDNRTQNQIDHITISRKWRNSLLDVRNRRGADVHSDHHLVVGQIKIKLAANINRLPKTARKLNVSKLQNEEIAQNFTQELRNNLINRSIQPPNERWNETMEEMQRTGEKILGFIKYERKEWITDETWKKIEERKEVKQKLNKSMNEMQRQITTRTYNQLNKEVGYSARRDKRRYLSNIADQAQQAADSNNMRETYRLAQKLTNKRPSGNGPIRALDGTIITSEIPQMERWTEHFGSLLNRPTTFMPQSPVETRPNERRLKINDEMPSTTEIKAAIKQLKNRKAAGTDNISAEMFKVDIALSSEILEPIINEAWQSEVIPNKWTEGLIIKLPKKGDHSVCDNWRGITLLNTISKIISIIIQKRISSVLEPTIRNEQAGFRPGRSCVDHINSLRIIAEQSAEWQAPIHLVFVDFKQAFDSLDRDMMWKILSSRGVSQKLLNIIRGLYNDAKCRVLHRGKIGDEFKVRSGVKQGCILSPLLFVIILDWVMMKTNEVSNGIQWNLLNRLDDLDFADDICLLTHTKADMKEKLRRLVKYAGQVGLTINVNKTKHMRLGPATNCVFSVNDQQIDETESFQYLGSYITKDGGADTDVANRIHKARQAYGMLNNVWRATQISRNLKLRIFRTNCLSVLLYGCETWKVTDSIVSKLQVFVNRCLRRILKIFWPNVISNEELWRRTNMEKISQIITRRKWNWIGHTLRRPDGDIARAALDWNPQGRRKRGRPKMTWRRTVIAEASARGKSWNEVKALAQNRIRWRYFVDALCSHAE